ncbi:MAG: PIG-L family deacetylase [Abitibacteriaceae bacterium]|nr:PIG-L family deacetylase [Abditibacteriaceae bacterium]MBV9866181.1 PIG-L family deacetylase [Abditibacteriaceae bacterium]
MEQLRIIVFGAHPDDCDLVAGGTAALWAQAGHHVRFVSVTNGNAGHQTMAGAALARRRREEAAAAGKVLGVEYLVLDHHDGELLPTLENRREIIRLIREHQPHLVLGPRPNDYHPDHRYTAVLVQDAAYMITVPNIVAAAEHVARHPVMMYTTDHFQKPYPFIPDVLVDIDSTVEKKITAITCHESQFFEWLPYNGNYLESVPSETSARQTWLHERMQSRLATDANRFRHQLIERYGPERGNQIKFAEAFELCEYGPPLTRELEQQIFPFASA